MYAPFSKKPSPVRDGFFIAKSFYQIFKNVAIAKELVSK